MPRTKRSKPLYQRGKYRLYQRAGRSALEIIWYDESRRRERSISARTADVREGRLALDREYLRSEGAEICPTCQRPWDGKADTLALTAIADYLLLSEGKSGFKSAKTRLGHVTRYLQKRPATSCQQITEQWIEGFRQWRLSESPIPSLSHVEGSVMQLAAAINAVSPPANFKARSMTSVANSPEYRADIETIAAMFDFALAEPYRDNLLRFLRASVATWARPDAIYDIHYDQWKSNARVLALNPAWRAQTKKHRPTVPIAHQFAPHLDELKGQYIPVASIRSSWDAMRKDIGLPKGVAGGSKLIRRSMATVARKRIGETDWIQGRMMLGHVKASTSDIYALPDPVHLGKVLAVTEAIIDEIESRVYRSFTANSSSILSLNGVKNGC